MDYANGERFYSFPAYCREHFGGRLYKVPLNAGMTCPNRDGTLGYRGCIFCSEGGSGEFAIAYNGQQITRDMLKYGRFPQDVSGRCIGYFQAYTNTYAPVPELRRFFTNALRDPLFAGISIATRPDCLGEDVLSLLAELKGAFPAKFIWVELGLQSIHEASAGWMRRGYDLPVFDEAVASLGRIRIPVIVHTILGLPGEDINDMMMTTEYLNGCGIFGIKMQLLQVLDHTDLGQAYREGKIRALSRQDYIDAVIGCLSVLDPSVVVHRLTGDGPEALLLAPLWSLDKLAVLNETRAEMKRRNVKQGCAFRKEKENG